MSLIQPSWAPRDHYGAALAVVAFALLALSFLGADPPTEPPWLMAKEELIEFVVEGPAKAHEARNWALFGEWHRNPVDNYQFWRIQSPLWVYPLAGAFRWFGTGYATLQAFAVGFALVGMIGLWRLLRDVAPGPLGVAAMWLYGTSLLVTLLSRSGMTEVVLNAAAVWMMWTLVRGRNHPGYLVASQIIFALAFFTKQGIIYLFPLLVVANVAAFLAWRREERFTLGRWIPVATAVVIAAFTTVYVVQPEYLRTVGWNTTHMVTGGGTGSARSVGLLERISVRRFGLAMWRFLPFVGLFSLPALGFMGLRAYRDRDDRSWVLAGWGASAWFAVLLLREWTLRHGSILVFPTLVLGAAAAASLLQGTRLPLRLRQGFVVVVVACGLASSIYEQGRRLSDARYTYDRFVEQAEAHIGQEAPVAIGRFAMPFLLGSRFDLFYVKESFNRTARAVRALAPTHFVLLKPRDDVEVQLRRMRLKSIVGDCPVQMRVWEMPMRLCVRDTPSN
ncbi:MAG: glycosyltransferase family 39 protein [Myxococcota bacterium]